MIDLHIHTSCSSDGQYGPLELIHMAHQIGISTLAFTEHMDISSVEIGLRQASRFNLEFFTGVEISTSFKDREYHLLYYGFQVDAPELKRFLNKHCSIIWEHALVILDSFREMGFHIEKEDIDRWGKSIPTGVTFLNALKKRNSKDKKLYEYLYGEKSFSPYLNFYKDFSHTELGASVSSNLPDLPETIKLFQGKGVLILAHPLNIEKESLIELKRSGLDGIEVYSTHHTRDTEANLLKTARSLDLLVSSGSDFHGELIKPDVVLGNVSGQPDEALLHLIRRYI